MTVTDDRQEEVPEAAPLPAEPSPPDAEPGEHEHGQEHEHDADGPPPLPPLLETGASTLATAGSGIYAAAGPAGLVAAAGIATVAGVAYGIRHHQNKKNATAAGSAGGGRGAGGRGRFGSSALGGGRTGRSTRSGAMSGRSGGRGAGSSLAGGRHRSSRAGSGALTGAGGRTARGMGGRGPLGSAGSAGRGGGRGRFGSGGSRSGGRSSAGGGLLGSTGASRSGRSTAGRGGSRGGGLFGAGSRSAGSARRSPSRRATGGGLFGGGAAGRSARRARGRTTAITDPAIPTGSGRGRLRRAMRRGWEHPRAHRARVRARKSWHRSRVRTRRVASRARVRIRDHSTRLASYLRKRKWALRVRGWGTSFSDWFSRLWDTLRGRASDPRYGRLKGWQLTAAAAAIGALGAGKKKSDPRPPLVGRIIGTAAPTPGEHGPLSIAGRTLLALTVGEGDAPLAPEVQRVKDAAEEMKAALSLLGGSQVGMLTYEQGLKQLGPILGIVADGLKDMASTAEDEQPLDPSVLEFFGTIEDAARGASQVAEELPGLFRAAHEVELDRLENPRRGEEKWDVSQQH